MSRENAEQIAESVVNEWNADYIEEDSTIDAEKGETLDNKKFYAHLERLIADAIEKAVGEQQSEIDRLKSELERVKVWIPTVECNGSYAKSVDPSQPWPVTSLVCDALKFPSHTACSNWCEIANQTAKAAYAPALHIIDVSGAKAEAERDTARQQLKEAKGMIEGAARQFREYERIHKAKGTVDGEMKAAANAHWAKHLEDFASGI